MYFYKINTPSGVWRSRSATAACEWTTGLEEVRGGEGVEKHVALTGASLVVSEIVNGGTKKNIWKDACEVAAQVICPRTFCMLYEFAATEPKGESLGRKN